MRRTRLYRDGMLEVKDFPAAQISDYLQQPGTVVWLDLCEPNPADLEVLSEEFGLHPLAVEDAIHEHQRPKLDATRPTPSSPPTPFGWTMTPASWRPASWPPSSPHER